MKPSLCFVLIALIMPTGLYGSFSIGPADVGFPGEEKPFTIRIQVLELPDNEKGTKKRAYDITLVVPNEMGGKPFCKVDLLSADGYPEDFEVTLEAREADKTHFSVNVRFGENVAKNFILRPRYGGFRASTPIEQTTPISSAHSGYTISVKDQVEKFEELKKQNNWGFSKN